MRGIKTVAETYQRKQYLHHAFRHVANLFFLANPMSLYTLTIADSKNLLSDDIKTAIKKDVDYVIANCIDRYVDWKGTLDFKVNIKTNAEFFNEVDWAKNLSNSDGCLPGTEMAWVGSRKSNLIEATTGIDLNGSESDAGNDKIDGGLDTDAAVYLAARANYTVDKTDSGLTVIDTTGTEGTDSLIAIERLQFTDVSLAFDTDAANNAGGIYRLYKAALNRTPDLVGLGYWIAQADAGSKDAVQMATDFTYADEFKTLYGVQTADNYMTGEDITALVTTIYENVLNRAPDAGGRDYYAGQITTHTKTVGRVLAEISDSAENYAQVAELIATGIPYTPWST